MAGYGGKREGAGRPKKPESEVRVKTTFTAPQWVLSKLDEIGGTRSKKIEAALIAHFKLKE